MYRYSASAARDLLFSGTAEAGALPPAERTGVLPISIGLPIQFEPLCAPPCPRRHRQVFRSSYHSVRSEILNRRWPPAGRAELDWAAVSTDYLPYTMAAVSLLLLL